MRFASNPFLDSTFRLWYLNFLKLLLSVFRVSFTESVLSTLLSKVLLILLVTYKSVRLCAHKLIWQGEIENSCWIRVVPLTLNFEKLNRAEIILVCGNAMLVLIDLLSNQVLRGPVFDDFRVINHPVLFKD